MTCSVVGFRVKVKILFKGRPVFISWPVVVVVEICIVLVFASKCGSNQRSDISNLPIQWHKDSYSEHRTDRKEVERHFEEIQQLYLDQYVKCDR
jgi:hypothetical protein